MNGAEIATLEDTGKVLMIDIPLQTREAFRS